MHHASESMGFVQYPENGECVPQTVDEHLLFKYGIVVIYVVPIFFVLLLFHIIGAKIGTTRTRRMIMRIQKVHDMLLDQLVMLPNQHARGKGDQTTNQEKHEAVASCWSCGCHHSFSFHHSKIHIVHSSVNHHWFHCTILILILLHSFDVIIISLWGLLIIDRSMDPSIRLFVSHLFLNGGLVLMDCLFLLHYWLGCRCINSRCIVPLDLLVVRGFIQRLDVRLLLSLGL
mmetsp:Transcript_34278/g.79092  ORF Transcript_34278/g.79092 Transcript_34278/m.79092 type:complete len:230 (+) Transcript_34278:928-1617(+)